MLSRTRALRRKLQNHLKPSATPLPASAWILLGLGATLGSLGLALLIRPIAYQVPFQLFCLAVAFSTALGGARAGVLCTAISLLAAHYFLLPPYGQFALAKVNLVRDGIFVVTAAVIIGFGRALRMRADAAALGLLRESRLREEIASASARLDLALSSAGLGSWSYDTASGEVRLDRRAQAIYGLGDGNPEWLATTIDAVLSRISPADLTAMGQSLAEMTSRTRGTGEMDYRIPGSARGEERWLHGTSRLISGAAEPARLVGTIVDVTERKRQELDLQLLEELSTALISSTGFEETMSRVVRLCVPLMGDWAGIDMVQPDRTLRRLAVWHRDEEMREFGKRVFERWPPTLNDPTGLGRVAREGAPEMYPEITDEMVRAANLPPDRLEATLRIGLRSYLAVPLRLQGRVVGVLSFAFSESPLRHAPRDLPRAEAIAARTALALEAARLYQESERERRRAEEAGRARDEFLAVVSHELRTPLTAILGYGALLRVAGTSAERVAKATEVIDRNARSLKVLVEDLLDVSRIVSGKLALSLAPTAPEAPVQAALEAVRPAADARRIELRAELLAAAEPLLLDGGRLQQIAWNLLSNAIKFTPEGGRVDLRLAEENGYLVLRVRDNGQGIDPAFLPSVFERFSQADASSTRRHGGLGLGLAIVRHLTELHGGTVQAESAGPGQGATFTVRLPMQRAVQRQPPREPARAAPSLEGVRVLVVDDQEDARGLLLDLLGATGARVKGVESVAAALRELSLEPHDVVLSDLAMPGEDGFALARHLRELDAAGALRVPAIAVSALARKEDRARSLEAGFVDHLTKPITPGELYDAVAAATRRAPRD